MPVLSRGGTRSERRNECLCISLLIFYRKFKEVYKGKACVHIIRSHKQTEVKEDPVRKAGCDWRVCTESAAPLLVRGGVILKTVLHNQRWFCPLGHLTMGADMWVVTLGEKTYSIMKGCLAAVPGMRKPARQHANSLMLLLFFFWH